MSQPGYAGDVSCQEAWEILRDNSDAVLIDVRSEAEWAYVGLPDLSELGKKPLLVPWQSFPDMRMNASFESEVEAKGVKPDQILLLFCRSGQRSRHAAMALTAAGYRRCYNVADGFEGPQDGQRHRGCVGGWKVAGLPWVQA